jgi:hypothetical protein
LKKLARRDTDPFSSKSNYNLLHRLWYLIVILWISQVWFVSRISREIWAKVWSTLMPKWKGGCIRLMYVSRLYTMRIFINSDP